MVLVWMSAVALAGPTLSIETRVGDGGWSTGPARALASEAVTARLPEQPDAEVRWFQVFPDLAPLYKNANHPWEPDPYQWVGFGEIAYSRVELTELRGRWSVPLFDGAGGSSLVADPGGSPHHHRDMGSFWLQAEVHGPGGVARSPGPEDKDHRGLTPAVTRITVRPSADLLGELQGYHNVPGLFGSVLHQSEHYIGVDCADVLVAAHARHRGTRMKRNLNVAMLVSEWKRVGTVEVRAGVPRSAVAWGTDVRPGDLLAVRYEGARQFGHVGAALEDADGDGVLSPADLVLHAGPVPLQRSPLSGGAFDGTVAILRP